MAVVGEYALCVQDPEGVFHSFLPGQKVPDWVVNLVTNPLALVGDPQDAGSDPDEGGPDDGQPSAPVAPTGPDGGEPAASVEPGPVVVGPGAGRGGGQPSAPNPAAEPPPQAGAGSGRDAWAQYASAQGVTVLEEWRRDQIIDACRKAGVAL
ncbi:hypothetical protein ONA92_02040 [Mycobacteroides salmoniphilum]|uniref:hypothetical protein n=1 Tax=Mycobacteroides salmoniphilum TaxID=404941 RepID=UPI003564263F